MADWKRSLLIGVGWGLGTAVGLFILVGGVLWYQSRLERPVPPKPWNTAAIKAEYDTINAEGPKNTALFVYTLENTTDFDYRVENARDITVSAKLREQNNLSPFGEMGNIDYPIFIPAKKRVRFAIHINYSYPVKEKDDANSDERAKFRREITKYVTDTFSNLDGFDLLDQTNRYEIIFPAGWKQPNQ